jgi:nucleotide-binding universal stress UspA family protein
LSRYQIDPRKEPEMKPVMLATDGSPTAEKATAIAIELARLLDTELVVVSVWDVFPAATPFGAIPVNSELAKLGEAEATRMTTEAAARAEEAGVEARMVVRRGFPVEVICSTADKYDPRFLVIGSHGWGAFKRALFGSVSTGVLHRASCPVLVVRGEPADAEKGKKPARDEVLA